MLKYNRFLKKSLLSIRLKNAVKAVNMCLYKSKMTNAVPVLSMLTLSPDLLSLCIFCSVSNSSQMFIHPSQFSEYFCLTLFLQRIIHTLPPHHKKKQQESSATLLPCIFLFFSFFFHSWPLALERTQMKGKQPQINSYKYRNTCKSNLLCDTFYTRFTLNTAYNFFNFYTNSLEKSPLNLVNYNSTTPFKPMHKYTKQQPSTS